MATARRPRGAGFRPAPHHFPRRRFGRYRAALATPSTAGVAIRHQRDGVSRRLGVLVSLLYLVATSSAALLAWTTLPPDRSLPDPTFGVSFDLADDIELTSSSLIVAPQPDGTTHLAINMTTDVKPETVALVYIDHATVDVCLTCSEYGEDWFAQGWHRPPDGVGTSEVEWGSAEDVARLTGWSITVDAYVSYPSELNGGVWENEATLKIAAPALPEAFTHRVYIESDKVGDLEWSGSPPEDVLFVTTPAPDVGSSLDQLPSFPPSSFVDGKALLGWTYQGDLRAGSLLAVGRNPTVLAEDQRATFLSGVFGGLAASLLVAFSQAALASRFDEGGV